MTTAYDTARAELLEAELALTQQRERVAELRRRLPPGPAVDDYAFTEGPADLGIDEPVDIRRLHDLCGDRPLVLYHFMLGGHHHDEACPMCAMWADGWNGVARHLAERVDFALVSSGPVAQLREVARRRGWTDLRLLSADGTSFKRDLGGEDAEGGLWPYLTVYERDGGEVRLSYGGGAHLRDEHWRGVDLLSPVWHLLDLTRPGRGDWMPS